MDDAADERCALSVEQGVMLWSMRVWVTGLHHDVDSPGRIRRMVERLGADEAAPYLDGFMFAIGHGAIRRLAVYCTCHTQVGADERLLLNVLSLAQEGRSLEALLLLRGLVNDQAAKAVLRSAQGLGTELALAGRFLQGAETDARPYEAEGGTETAAWHCRTVH